MTPKLLRISRLKIRGRLSEILGDKVEGMDLKGEFEKEYDLDLVQSNEPNKFINKK